MAPARRRCAARARRRGVRLRAARPVAARRQRLRPAGALAARGQRAAGDRHHRAFGGGRPAGRARRRRDDFVIKPFATAELISRIRAVLRRSARQASEAWALGPLAIEPRRHTASLHGKPLELSPREFKLLLELAREPGAVVAKGVLAQKLEPLGEPVDFAAVEVHVSNLRRKIGSTMVHTVRGVGYMLAS
jgi:hypothetical protein